MKRAVEISLENVRNGGEPFGAVLVKDGEIITEGANELHETYDISGHAEMIAIRQAQAKLQTHDLSGYVMYASGEPSPLCLTAMYMSGIEEGYHCASIEDAADVGLDGSGKLYGDLKKARSDRKLKMSHVPVEPGDRDPSS